MMKKVLILFVVLAITSVASASQVDFTFKVDPADQKASYEYSDIITINLTTEAQVIGLDIGAISDGGGGGTAQLPLSLNANFTAFADVGYLTNDGQTLIKWIAGNAGAGLHATGILYSFEYHVPDVEDSTWITIGDFSGQPYWPALITYLGGDEYEGPLTPLEIHVTPEPITIALLGLGGLFLRRRK
jgi:hypothetical protein